MPNDYLVSNQMLVLSKAKFVHVRGEKSHFEKELLLTMINHLGLIHEGSNVNLDFDHQFIPAHKDDATYSYKGDYGYFPGWATIGGIFVGGENRDDFVKPHELYK